MLEQFERTDHLIALLPESSLQWMPPIPGAWPPGILLGHLLDCAAGCCAVLYAANPDRLGHFQVLRELPVNHACAKDEARSRLKTYEAHLDEGFDLLSDDDLARLQPTAFVTEGESILTLLLGNLEHLINHKHQLLTYLKLLNVPVGTPDLYHFRSSS